MAGRCGVTSAPSEKTWYEKKSQKVNPSLATLVAPRSSYAPTTVFSICSRVWLIPSWPPGRSGSSVSLGVAQRPRHVGRKASAIHAVPRLASEDDAIADRGDVARAHRGIGRGVL